MRITLGYLDVTSSPTSPRYSAPTMHQLDLRRVRLINCQWHPHTPKIVPNEVIELAMGNQRRQRYIYDSLTENNNEMLVSTTQRRENDSSESSSSSSLGLQHIYEQTIG